MCESIFVVNTLQRRPSGKFIDLRKNKQSLELCIPKKGIIIPIQLYEEANMLQLKSLTSGLHYCFHCQIKTSEVFSDKCQL